MGSPSDIEDRVASLEQEVALLKAKLAERKGDGSWVDRLSGTFEGDEGFREIVRLGKEMRDAEQPDDTP